MAWSNSISITIDHTKVSGAQVNFPLLVAGNYRQLATVTNGGSVTSASGYDIIFASDSLGASPIAFERQAWQPVTGACEFWVLIASLSASVDTVIYILFGNSAVTTEQATPSAVWDANFKAVYHLADTGGLNILDSTGANNGTSNTAVLQYPAEFGRGGISCVSTGVALPSMALSVFTISAWINPSDNGFFRAIFGSGTSGVEFRRTSTGALGLLRQGVAGIGVSSGTPASGAWVHATVTYDGTTATYYINGSASGTGVSAQSFTTTTYVIGRATGVGEDWFGFIDEFHLSTSVRSAGWLLTEYNNQSAPATFYTTALTVFNPGIPWGPFPTWAGVARIVDAGAGPRHQVTRYSTATAVSGTVSMLDTVLPSAIVGLPYSQTLSPSGGVAPYTFLLVGGSFPAGVSISSSGIVSGTPSGSAATFTPVISVTDALGGNMTQTFTLALVVAVSSNSGFVA